MTYKSILTAVICVLPIVAEAYTPAGVRLMTEWGEKVTPENVWTEYPRPAMVRDEWMNLNGLWDYAITDQSKNHPESYEGEILVPFAVESALSGVCRNVGEKQALWYKRTFTLPSDWKNRDVLLNFGAVDWQADVWVNDIKIGTHKGGYAPFSFDITPALRTKGENEITVRVWDPTDRGTQPRGKQVSKPESIWYTPVTGIWQTVWLEPVARDRIESLKIVSDIDTKTLKVDVNTSGNMSGGVAEVKVMFDGAQVGAGRSVAGQPVVVDLTDNMHLWSPETPALYQLEVNLYKGGKAVDVVRSYAAMRKFSSARDKDGIMRMCLNGKPLFQFGPLDQGWWPDGLYTAPSCEAMIYDIDKTKELGFNMIRKHVKVEPALWYAYCDRLGIIVWQDMPNGDNGPGWQNDRYYTGPEAVRTAVSEADYRMEWREIMDCLYNYPCIAVWVPFNESWGQFKTVEIAEWTKGYDPTRLVNPASGGNFYPCGDILDYHHYPQPEMVLYDAQRVTAIGEYGGIGMVVDGHIWSPERNWGYVELKTPQEVTSRYVDYARRLEELVPKGISAAVYTQTTDVEGEINGLMTYDRKVVKVEIDSVRQANMGVCRSLE